MNRKALRDDRMDIGKEFAHAAGDLTDTEVTQIFKVVEQVRLRYAGKKNTPDNLEHLRDEVLTRLMEIGILATLDPTPCYYGEPPTLEIIGKITGDSIHKHGFDHEKKMYEVRKAVERNEEWLGEKEGVNKRKDGDKR
jgi:hypothetical protein